MGKYVAEKLPTLGRKFPNIQHSLPRCTCPPSRCRRGGLFGIGMSAIVNGAHNKLQVQHDVAYHTNYYISLLSNEIGAVLVIYQCKTNCSQTRGPRKNDRTYRTKYSVIGPSQVRFTRLTNFESRVSTKPGEQRPHLSRAGPRFDLSFQRKFQWHLNL